jgi:hypothetical protein
MNRVAMVGSSAQGGVAHSTASRIPWQKRIEGTAIQSGGGSGMLRYGLKKKMLKNQRGGGTWKYFKRTGDMVTGRRKPQKGGFSRVFASLERGRKKPQKGGWWSKETGEKLGFRQKGGFLKSLERSMFGVKRTKGKGQRPQKGGFWGALERNMFGVKRTKGKKKRPQVTHNQKGGVLGLDKFSSYYNGKSKKEQQEMDNWAARNL